MKPDCEQTHTHTQAARTGTDTMYIRHYTVSHNKDPEIFGFNLIMCTKNALMDFNNFLRDCFVESRQLKDV